MSSYFVKCKCCSRKFTTLYSLLKHYEDRHTDSSLDETEHKFYCKEGSLYEQPQAIPISKNDEDNNDEDNFVLWLSGLAERINNALHPCLPGKWYNIDCCQVPTKFFSAFRHQLGCSLYGVRDTTRKRPVYAKDTQRLSYKIFCVEDFLDAFRHYGIYLKKEAFYHGEKEINNEYSTDNVQDLLEMATNRAHNRSSALRTTSKSKFCVGYGEGRATREIELIWWPGLYLQSANGHLTVRIFLQKINI